MTAATATPAQSAEAVDLVQRAINRWFAESPPCTQRAALIDAMAAVIVERDEAREQHRIDRDALLQWQSVLTGTLNIDPRSCLDDVRETIERIDR